MDYKSSCELEFDSSNKMWLDWQISLNHMQKFIKNEPQETEGIISEFQWILQYDTNAIILDTCLRGPCQVRSMIHTNVIPLIKWWKKFYNYIFVL